MERPRPEMDGKWDAFMKYVFRFFQTFCPQFALKLANSAYKGKIFNFFKNSVWVSENAYSSSILSSNPRKDAKKLKKL
jgi:hypothetical protein